MNKYDVKLISCYARTGTFIEEVLDLSYDKIKGLIGQNYSLTHGNIFVFHICSNATWLLKYLEFFLWKDCLVNEISVAIVIGSLSFLLFFLVC